MNNWGNSKQHRTVKPRESVFKKKLVRKRPNNEDYYVYDRLSKRRTNKADKQRIMKVIIEFSIFFFVGLLLVISVFLFHFYY